MTDSKSVGSNTVRVRPPPSAPKSVTPLNEWGYTFYVLVGGRTRILRVVHGCTIAVEQSRCTMQRPKRPHFDTPRHISLSQTGISLLFLVLGGRTRTVRVVQGCTIAVAQSRCKDAATQTTAFRHPATFRYHKQAFPCFFGAGGRTRTVRVRHGCLIK